ncbi:MAG: DUF1080 domain-containing protein [Candidatus Omnitrophica bacterium]|nr:DUF1080 domain-containing protein [Candidatus Omnitrophota bacterium]
MKYKTVAWGVVIASLMCIGMSLNAAETEEAGRGSWTPLFDGKTLDGWEQINGTAKYVVEDGAIKGTTVEGSPNSFLCTKKHYSDFVLEFEVLVDDRLNSGVQIRSNSFSDFKDGRVHGYQAEIAVNGNAGLIYDEARRAQWVDMENCEQTDEAKAAFKKGEWNKFIILCVGDNIFTWINGVNIAHISDSMTKSGFIGLQVHAFRGETPAWVKWRNIRIREL